MESVCTCRHVIHTSRVGIMSCASAAICTSQKNSGRPTYCDERLIREDALSFIINYLLLSRSNHFTSIGYLNISGYFFYFLECFFQRPKSTYVFALNNVILMHLLAVFSVFSLA